MERFVVFLGGQNGGAKTYETAIKPLNNLYKMRQKKLFFLGQEFSVFVVFFSPQFVVLGVYLSGN